MGDSDTEARLRLLEEEVKTIKGEVEEVQSDVKLVIRNHLPHISAAIHKLDLKTTKQISNLTARVTIIGGLIFGAIGALIALFISKGF